MGDALSTAGRRGSWRQPLPIATFLVLATFVVSSHAAAASLAWSFYDAGRVIFVGVQDPDVGPLPSLVVPSADAESPGPGETPPPQSPTTPPRINILLTGIDSDENRSTRPDRHDPRRQHRPDDRRRRDGQLPARPGPAADARRQDLHGQDQLADDLRRQASRTSTPTAALAALATQVGFLLGAPIDYYASVDLDGFRKLIDRVGGVTVNVQTAINDPRYGGWDTRAGSASSSRPGSTPSTARRPSPSCARARGSATATSAAPAASSSSCVALQRKLTDPAMLPKLPGLLDGRGRDDQDQLPARPDRRDARARPARSTRRRSRVRPRAARTRSPSDARPEHLHPASRTWSASRSCRSSCSAPRAGTPPRT